MLPPLSHIPDTSVWHYRLQLNIYAYIVQKYYGHSVSGMTIVCCHPDNEGEPWLDAVPWMVDDVEKVLKSDEMPWEDLPHPVPTVLGPPCFDTSVWLRHFSPCKDFLIFFGCCHCPWTPSKVVQILTSS